MSQAQKNLFDKTAAVKTAGRELIDSALQRNPIASLAATVITPIAKLIGRRAKTDATVRKMKLESYSYAPVARPRKRNRRRTEATLNTVRTHTEHTLKPDTTKGGAHHG
jgi:hypothetical protein